MNPRRTTLRTCAIAAPAILAMALVGCGSGASDGATSRADTAPRSASDAPCPQLPGATEESFTIRNDIDETVTLRVPRESWACDGFSGTFNPARLNGRTVAPGNQVRVRLDTGDRYTFRDTGFALELSAGGSVMGSVKVRQVSWAIDGTYPWGLESGGRYNCNSPAVELAGGTAWVSIPAGGCRRSLAGTLQITRTRPT